jgi:hypothetical protein
MWFTAFCSTLISQVDAGLDKMEEKTCRADQVSVAMAW